MEKKVLFGEAKTGKFKIWCIWTEGDMLYIEHGQEGGKQQLKEEKIKGKNIGRANETTPEQQAELEAMSRWRKQIDKGYRESKDELGELEVAAMLAQDYHKQGHKITYPCYGSEKLDGVRCLAIRHADRVELKSRGGKQYDVEHIKQQLMYCMVEGDIFDGEIYLHGKYLEEIVSAVKKTNELTQHLEYIIFDIVNDKPFFERLIDLEKIQVKGKISKIKYVEFNNEEDMKNKHGEYIKKGYEGCMIRNIFGLYESGKRSCDLQKYKEFFDEEFVVIGVSEDVNGNAVLECFDPIANCNFNVCYGDHSLRKYQLEHPHEFIGRFLTVKYQTRYKDSRLPQFPVGLSFREGRFEDGEFKSDN